MAITKISPDVVDFDSALVVSPTLTIGDATAEDTKIVFDGNAQDFYIGLDDSADDLIIGLGSTVGTTPAISVDEDQKVTFGSDITIPNRIFHDGDTDTYFQFDAANSIRFVANGAEVSRYGTAGVIFNEDSGDLDFRVESNGDANMLFVDGGNNRVLIGTAASRAMSGVTPNLFIEGNSGYNDSSLGLVVNSNSTGEIPTLLFGRSRGTSDGAVTILQSGDRIASIRAHGADGTDFEQSAAIEFYVDATPGANEVPGRIGFYTTADGDQYITERMRIHNGGVVSIPGGIELGSALDATAANTLDDYEEGTFTPVFFGTTQSVAMTNYGYYRKIGSLVFFTFYSGAQTFSSSSGSAGFAGLPFTSISGTYSPGSVAHANCCADNDLQCYVGTNASAVYFMGQGATSATTMVDGSGKYAMVSGCYPAA
jgi:hypothetical protein